MQRMSAAIRPALGAVLAFACAVSACTRNDNVETGHRDAEGYLRFPDRGLSFDHTCAVDATLRADVTYHDILADHKFRSGFISHCMWRDVSQRRMTALTKTTSEWSCTIGLPEVLENPSPSQVLLDWDDVESTCFLPDSLIDHHRLAPPEITHATQLDGLRQICFRVLDYNAERVGYGKIVLYRARENIMLPVRYIRSDGPLVDIWLEEAPSPWNASIEDVLIEASYWDLYGRTDTPNLELRDCAEAIQHREAIQ